MAVSLVAAACGAASDQAGWAVEAEAWHDGLVEAQIAQGGDAYARFLSPDVVYNDSGVFAEEAAAAIKTGELAIAFAGWVLGPESLRLEPQIYISVDGLVELWFYDWAPLGMDFLPDTKEPAHGVGLMAPIGPLGAEALIIGMAIEDWRDRHPGWPQAAEAEAVATSWTRVWSGTTDDIDVLYRHDARLQDSIAGIDITGRDSVADPAAASGTWEITTVAPDDVRGVYLFVRERDDTKVLEEVLLVVAGQDETGCEGEMVVWLVLDEGQVAAETRYWPIERARRCLPADELPDGWWTGRPVPPEPGPPEGPPEDVDTPTDPLVVGDATIAVYNGTPNLNRLLAWGLDRFEIAGLSPPRISSVTFTLYSDFCDDMRARYHPTADGAELNFCFNEDHACWGEDCARFVPGSRRLVLHEYAHAWIDDTLDDNARQQYTDHVGRDAWNDSSVAWRERAVEHAADTMAWGLLDRDLIMLHIGSPSPEQLTEGFRMLTNTDPLPRTDDFRPAGGE
jgi:hypothetical protein